MFKFRFIVVIILLALVSAACAGAEPAEEPAIVAEPAEATTGDGDMADTGGDGEMVETGDDDEMVGTSREMEDEHDETAGDEMRGEDAMTGEDEMAAGPERPTWQQISLTNARTGESFTFADFAGKTVFVEPMATWCTNCRRQLTNVSQAHADIGSDEVIFVALSVETSLAPERLAEYAEAAGFNWHFAVMSPEMLEQLVAAFGRSIANPPATPHFVIRPDGSTTALVTGIEPAAQLMAQIEAAQG